MGVDNTEADSPDVSTTPDEHAVDQTDVTDAGADSSPAPDGEKADLLSVVRDATSTQADPDSQPGDHQSDTSDEDSSTDDDSQSEADEDDEIEADQREPDDEDFSDVPFSKHPRFKKLIQQRNDFREGHRQYEAVQSYLRENGLTSEEAAQALHQQALLKRDPVEAWKTLKPIVQDLLVKTGEVLPSDLRERVQKGELSKQAATELSRLRAQQGVQQQRQQYDQQLEQQNAQHRQQVEMQTAASEWERAKRADPNADFDKMAEDIQKEVVWMMRTKGQPKDAVGVHRILDEAYRSVRKRHAPPRNRQQKTPVRGGQVTSGQSRSTETPSIEDIVAKRGRTG